MNDNITDKDIIKALECCPKGVTCEQCPLGGTKDCMTKLYVNSLDLITRQQTENKRLGKEVNLVSIQFQDLQERYEEAQAEIESLKADKIIAERHEKDARELFKDVVIRLKTAKSEAVKEFAERLKEKSDSRFDYSELVFEISEGDIDNLVKEMVGENK